MTEPDAAVTDLCRYFNKSPAWLRSLKTFEASIYARTWDVVPFGGLTCVPSVYLAIVYKALFRKDATVDSKITLALLVLTPVHINQFLGFFRKKTLLKERVYQHLIHKSLLLL